MALFIALGIPAIIILTVIGLGIVSLIMAKNRQ